MDWQGIAALLAVGVSALSAILNFRQQSYNKQQEYLLKKREEDDKKERAMSFCSRQTTATFALWNSY